MFTSLPVSKILRDISLHILFLSGCVNMQGQDLALTKGYVLDNRDNPISDVHIYTNGLKLLDVSLTDGSFNVNLLSVSDTIFFTHVSYKDVILPYNVIYHLDGIVHLEESITWLNGITVHPLTPKQLFVTAVNNMKNGIMDYSAMTFKDRWIVDQKELIGKALGNCIDTLKIKELYLPIIDRINGTLYFDYMKTQAAVFNVDNLDDYYFEYVKDTLDLQPSFTRIKCINKSFNENFIVITIYDKDFTIAKVAFRYYWNTVLNRLSEDLKYQICELAGESFYNPITKKIVRIETETTFLIGSYDIMHQKFLPCFRLRKIASSKF